MKIAIRGHKSRGKEVIQILESLGGKKLYYLNASDKYLIFFIDDKGYISCFHHENPLVKECFKIYTLEEFEKEFPFKIGDEVIIIGLPDYPKVITKMTWMDNEVFYTFGDNTWYNTGALRKLEMKEERNITLTLDKAKEWYKKGGDLKQVALQAFSEKELTKVDLPKTWEEFCENHTVQIGECWLGNMDTIQQTSRCSNRTFRNWIPSKKSAEAHLAMIQLEQLRNCWWGDWEPIWDCSQKYCIYLSSNEIQVRMCTNVARFLTFPTREMAEEFLNCFRNLIKKAEDLI